jgi:hypothetical protein
MEGSAALAGALKPDVIARNAGEWLAVAGLMMSAGL